MSPYLVATLLAEEELNLLALAEGGKWLASNGWTALPQPQTRELCLQMETRIRGVCLQIKENKTKWGTRKRDIPTSASQKNVLLEDTVFLGVFHL